MQGSKGITHCTSPMMIHKFSPSVDCNEWLKLLDTQLNNQPIKTQLKSPKRFHTEYEKVIIKLWGHTCEINTAYCPLPPCNYAKLRCFAVMLYIAQK